MRFEQRLLGVALLAPLPAVAAGLALLWTARIGETPRIVLTVLIIAVWIGAALALRNRVVRPLQTISNLLAALREGDFSIRARGARPDDALGLALLEVNALSETLREQRTGALEAAGLLRKVMAEIDVAIFAFDQHGLLRLANRAGERLLDRAAPRLLGRTADQIGLAFALHGATPRTLEHAFPGGAGRWEIRRASFRQGGEPLELLVLADLRRALREEERDAWQRLVRVLSHEINNSLTPIHSIAGTLRDMAADEEPPADWRDDLRDGLDVIAGRSRALSRFMGAYARLARLPPPKLAPLRLRDCVYQVLRLEPAGNVRVHPGPDLTLLADVDQLEQALINLVRNAVEAAAETGGAVDVEWTEEAAFAEVSVRDQGPGLAGTANLFVPFFTTKPGGSGIGLALGRQIAEAHHGTLTVENRDDGPGAIARLRLPI